MPLKKLQHFSFPVNRWRLVENYYIRFPPGGDKVGNRHDQNTDR
jgi:hypothetical protein